MKALRSWIALNPILVKELRSRMRGSRAFITLTVALVIMALLMVGLASLLTRSGDTFGNLLSPQIGQSLFDALVIFELLLVCTVTPALTAGAISSEREKLTFEMLLSTPLGPAKIIWGKLISALSYVFLLIFAAVPLASLVFLFGGIAPMTMLKGLFVLLVVAVTMGIYGLFLSALLGRTGRATVVSFVSVMGLVVGPLMVMIGSGLFFSSRVLALPRLLLALSPVSMLVSAVETVNSNAGGFSGLFSFIGGHWDVSMDPLGLTQIPRPIYHYSLALCGVLSIVLFTLTIGLINPARRFFLSKRTALTGGALLAFFLAGVAGAYLLTAPRYEWVQVNGNVDPKVAARGGLVVKEAPFPAVGMAVAVPAMMATPTPVPPPGAGASPTLITAQQAGLALSEQVAIYAAAARQVYRKDSTLGDKAPQFPVLYLVSRTNDRTGAPDQPDAGSNPISPELQAGISAALSDLPAKLAWVSGLEEVPLDPKTGAVPGGGLVINFGNIQVQSDGSVQLPSSAYLASLIGGGQTYRLEKSAGEWKVVGTTGSGWIQ